MLPPQVKIDWGIDLEKVKSSEFSGEIYDRLLKIAQVEWSDARALQHLTTLIRATAALDGREEVIEDDLKLLDMLMRPMILERYLFTKSGFESGRVLDVNLAALIVEFASWKRLDIERIVRDYKVSPTTAYRLVKNLNGWVEHTKTGMKASKELAKILEEIGVKINE